MAYTALGQNDNGSTSRSTINTNFGSVDTQLATKVEYSGTVPADGDLVVASGATGKVIKKKVFTASQTLESDSNGQPTSAAKATGYNLALGTSAGTVLEGSNDALYMKLAGAQTVTGVKTHSVSPLVPTASNSSNDTTAASTAFVKNVTPTPNLQKFQGYAYSALPTSFNVAHGLPAAPTYVKVTAITDKGPAGTIQSVGTYKSGSYSTYYLTTLTGNPPAYNGTGTTTSTIAQFDWQNTGTNDDIAYTMTISAIDATNISFAITRTLGAGATGNVLFVIEYFT